MNIYDALNFAEANGHRASLQSDGRWFLIRKSDRAIVNIGYSIIEAVSVLVQPEPEVVETVETVETVEVVADAATTEAESEVVETVAIIETANLSNYDIVTLAENNGFRVSLQANGEWHLIRKADRQVTVIGYNLRDAIAVINPAPETMSQVEIERGYAAQEAEEHAAWVAEQEDDDMMTVGMAAMILNDKRCGLATEEESDEAYGVMVRAVAAELRARGVTFYQDSLGDWIWCGEFDGDETAESLADEWQRDNDYAEEYA